MKRNVEGPGEYILVYKEVEGLRRWWESYPSETLVERVRALGDSCEYWHSCWQIAMDELEMFRGDSEDA